MKMNGPPYYVYVTRMHKHNIFIIIIKPMCPLKVSISLPVLLASQVEQKR